MPGDPWDGQGQQGLSQDDAEQFSDYPTYWLGEEFAGYNLQAIIREDYQPEPPIPAYEAMDSLGFGYGDCVIPEGASACSVPILIKTEPICLTRPETVAPVAKASELETTRGGAQVLRFADGHMRLWTGNVSIYLSASVDYDLTIQMASELVGFNTDLSASEDLPAPDFSSCSPPGESLETATP